MNNYNEPKEWIIPCNANSYDIRGALKKLQKLDWRQTKQLTNASVGNLVYLYCKYNGKGAIWFKGAILKVNKTEDFVDDFQRYLMIVKSVGIVNASLIRSKNVLNFGYILYIALRDKGIQANVIETIVRRWLVLYILTGRYSGSPESTFDYDIKRFIAVMELCETKEAVYGGIVDKDVLKKNLEASCIPEDFVNMEAKDYNRFLEERRLLMAKKIRLYYEGLK